MTDDNYDDIDAEVKPKRKFNFGMMLGTIIPVALILATLVYIAIFQQDATTNFLKKYDFIGVTTAGSEEKSRQYQINNLDIPFEQRQALKEGTIFLGATKEMVLLALGQPAEKPKTTETGQEKWVYFFSENSRPTYLFFEKDKLVNAAKGTTLDNAEIQ